MIELYFDREKRIMANYYFDKSKKQKKFRAMNTSLQSINPEFRE
jgi:hypothetical protein